MQAPPWPPAPRYGRRVCFHRNQTWRDQEGPSEPAYAAAASPPRPGGPREPRCGGDAPHDGARDTGPRGPARSDRRFSEVQPLVGWQRLCSLSAFLSSLQAARPSSEPPERAHKFFALRPFCRLGRSTRCVVSCHWLSAGSRSRCSQLEPVSQTPVLHSQRRGRRWGIDWAQPFPRGQETTAVAEEEAGCFW